MRDALNEYSEDNDQLQGSIIEMITVGDQVRKEVFKEIELYPRLTLLGIDMNFRGTIERT